VDAAAVSDRTTLGVFLRQAERHADRPLVHHYAEGAWKPVTWRGLEEMALRVAARLVEAGVAAGDRVLLMSENRVEWLACDLGIQAAGAVTVPVYPSSTPEVVKAIAANSSAVLAIASGERQAACIPVEGQLARLVRIDRDLPAWLSEEAPVEATRTVAERLRALSPEDLATIVYTSGTTGEPKGVVLAHRNLVDMARSCLRAFRIGPDDVSFSFLPLAHVFGRINDLFVGMAAGGSTYLHRGMDTLVEDIRQVRPTTVCSVPRLYEKMRDGVLAEVARQPAWKRRLFAWALATGRRGGWLRPLADRLVLRPLRTRLTGGRLRFFVSGGAPLSEEVERFFWAVGIPILQGWGMTETSSGATSNTEDAHRVGTVGRPLPGVRVRIAEDGEVLVAGPGTMLGYFQKPEATAEVLADGWLRTGDVGELDPDGFLRITDRKKDLIKTAGGKYVAPQPLEARLQEDALIERAVVIGDGRPYVTALIVPSWAALQAHGVQGDPDRLVSDERARELVGRAVKELNATLGSWETIKYFALLPEDFSEERGEVTPTLKVRRRAVQERYRELIDSMYQGRRQDAAS
jgi:long-chain acyl-CoA synthetase